MTHEVFISYSANDKLIADAVNSTLESKGIRCWIAPRDILPGMDWGEAIIDAITTSRVMVLVLSLNSNTSSQVRREVERAVNKEVIIIPFRIEEVSLSKSLEYHLSSTHWMDALTPPLEEHIETLAEKIKLLSSLSGIRDFKPVSPISVQSTTPPPPLPVSSDVALTVFFEPIYSYGPELTIKIYLDGQLIGTGNQRAGTDLTVQTTKGTHTLDFHWENSWIFRGTKLSYNIDLSSGRRYRATLIKTMTNRFKLDLREERA